MQLIIDISLIIYHINSKNDGNIWDKNGGKQKLEGNQFWKTKNEKQAAIVHGKITVCKSALL